MTESFLETWPRRSGKPMDPEEDLVRFVDLPFPAQGMRDPERFEFARFQGELWGDVPNIRALQWRVANALCKIDMDRLRAAEHGGHVVPERGRHKRHAPKPLPGGMFLYQGWATHWLADNIRIWVEEFGLQDELHVKLIDPEELLGAAP